MPWRGLPAAGACRRREHCRPPAGCWASGLWIISCTSGLVCILCSSPSSVASSPAGQVRTRQLVGATVGRFAACRWAAHQHRWGNQLQPARQRQPKPSAASSTSMHLECPRPPDMLCRLRNCCPASSGTRLQAVVEELGRWIGTFARCQRLTLGRQSDGWGARGCHGPPLAARQPGSPAAHR